LFSIEPNQQKVCNGPQVLDKNTDGLEAYYREIGNHLANTKDYITAEIMYVKGGMQKEAIEMYNKAGEDL